jgi:16S rRNA (cytidine1402-2'-O)-methyltransferase
MTQVRGRLFLLASPITENGLETIPASVTRVVHGLRYFIAERERTARRYIRALGHPLTIDELTIEEMPQDIMEPKVIERQMQPLLAGHDIGILSEAGLPAIADPGNAYVAWAHRSGIDVVPCSGPSSLMMALMASGLEGQRFAFHGYLSAKKEELGRQLKEVEQRANRDQATQIFIETPYRNQQVMEAVIQHVGGERLFCIAANVGGEGGYVKTKRVRVWAKEGFPEVHKIPCVFLLR